MKLIWSKKLFAVIIAEQIIYKNDTDSMIGNVKKSNVKQRSFRAVNLKQFSKINLPDEVGFLELSCPFENQRVLRCIVRELRSGFKIPFELEWLREAITITNQYQREVLQVEHPFCYITVRHGEVDYLLDDEFHADGFSMRATTLPEQNYVWSDIHPTEYVTRSFNIPADFDPLIHNIHQFFQDSIDGDDEILTCKEKTFYLFDTYVVHRRPVHTKGIRRTFVRITYCPSEIRDVNNTINPLMPRQFEYCGLKDFRNKLTRYEAPGAVFRSKQR